jgi:SurA N-terminal domain
MAKTCALVPLLLLLGSCSDAPAPDAASSQPGAPTPDPARPLPLPLPDVVARVDGQEIRIRQILPLAKAALDRVSVSDRDKRKPEAVRQALDSYVTRELLLQEAFARGISADTRDVEQNYDQLRANHKGDAEWGTFLSEQGMDPQSFKAELRVQHTVAALLAREIEAWPVPEAQARAAFESNPRGFGPPGAAEPPSFDSVRSEVEQALRQQQAEEIQAALVARLRARAKIELYL